MNQATTTTIALAVFGLVSAHAGTGYTDSTKMPAPMAPEPLKVPTLCSCFDINTASVSIYGAGMLPDNTSEDLDDAFGAGIAIDYFFTEYIGIEVDATWSAQDSAVHLFTGSMVFRLPIKEICLAPYVFGGGGIHSDSETQGVFHAGAGIDWRFNNCIGIFADGRYTWANDTQDYALVRAGVRFGF